MRYNYRHGMSHTKENRIWRNMRYRCLNKNCKIYDRYGGRGISICERWDSFENFYDDMGDKPDGMSLDRKDNDGNYEPSNCRWATSIEQHNNRSNNIKIDHDGEIKTVPQLSRENNIPLSKIYSGIRKGVQINEIILNKNKKPIRTGRPAKKIYFNGEFQTINEISIKTGVSKNKIYSRLGRGMTVSEAIFLDN